MNINVLLYQIASVRI